MQTRVDDFKRYLLVKYFPKKWEEEERQEFSLRRMPSPNAKPPLALTNIDQKKIAKILITQAAFEIMAIDKSDIPDLGLWEEFRGRAHRGNFPPDYLLLECDLTHKNLVIKQFRLQFEKFTEAKIELPLTETLFQSLMELGKHDPELLQRCKHARQLTTEGKFEKACELQRSGDFKGAINIFSKFDRSHQYFSEANYKGGECCFEASKQSQSLEESLMYLKNALIGFKNSSVKDKERQCLKIQHFITHVEIQLELKALKDNNGNLESKNWGLMRTLAVKDAQIQQLQATIAEMQAANQQLAAQLQQKTTPGPFQDPRVFGRRA